ncbi:prenyltransferase [Thermococcus sp. M36]|uniref:prenyltransferase n=1 Tax=Thermococcus sp. M36 TaxID=1638261 RepID=UPI00143C0C51|nr:prenyltransferase [Thermococcus sp. M36]NJE04993.1 prenyltransferase [Thermococcus sp. M36]
MLVEEILSSVDVIQDPYIKSTTYAKIGERLARAKHNGYRAAFLKSIETAREIDDPVRMFRALLSTAYSMRKAGIKSAKRIFRGVLEDSKVLPRQHRDAVMASAVSYLISLGDFGDAVVYALEITDGRLRDDLLLEIIRVNSKTISRERLKVTYRLRRSQLALEYIRNEPQRSKALFEFIKSHLAVGNYEKSISLLGQIGRREWARQAFKEVVFYLKERGVLGHYIDVLVETARGLAERFGESFKWELALAFALTGEGFSAVELVRELEDPGEILVRLAVELFDRDPYVLPAFIDALDDDETTLVGKALLNRILDNPSPSLAGLVEAVVKNTRSEEVWVKAARYYVLTDRLDLAKEIGLRIQNPKLRSVVMADVAHSLLRKGRVGEAVDAALEVREPKYSSILISEILVGALDRELSGRVKQWNGSRR